MTVLGDAIKDAYSLLDNSGTGGASSGDASDGVFR